MSVTELSNLRADALDVARGDTVLIEKLSFELWPGRALQLSGPNGSGKTTLLRTLTGLRQPHAGRVSWCGQDVHAGVEGYAGELLYLGHDNALNPDLSALENLELLARLDGATADMADIAAALRAMGLSRAQSRRPCGALSAGQRRRTALARLRLSEAPLWLLDEPGAALDVNARAMLGELIRDHVKAGGMLLFTTHEALPLDGINVDRLALDA